MRRLLLCAVAFLVLFALGAREAGAQERVWTTDDTHTALRGAPAVIDCIVRRESEYQPYAVGAAGELGVAQLHPRGLLPEFLYGDWTPLPPEYRSPFNPWQSVAFLEQWGQTHGHLRPWSTWRLCQ